MIERNKIGERLGQIRTERNLTQKELAEKIGVKREMITYWENGTREIPTSKVISLAAVLNISCDELLLGVKPNYANIYNELGLSQKAIENIISVSHQYNFADILLSKTSFLSGLIHKIYLYVKILKPSHETRLARLEQALGGINEIDVAKYLCTDEFSKILTQLEKVLNNGNDTKKK